MLYSNPNKNGRNFSPPRPLDQYPQDSIKYMAVLFTDIVGSSKYFKSQGDILGRKMLKRHQNIASPAITDYGGVPVKFLGDSVMAYFLNPKEALKSAIKIQQAFQHHNRGKEAKEEIRVRICVHFGQGIVEENDIFGDVVNTAAKFLPYAGGDQIFISQKTYDQVKDMSTLHFETVDIIEKKGVLKGLTIYNVLWEEGINLEPVLQTLLYLKPLLKLNKNEFPETWNHFLKVRKTLWGSEVRKESLLSDHDQSIALIVKSGPAALDLAINLKNFLKVNLGQEGVLFIPVQIINDAGPYLMADKLSLKEFKVNLEAFDPGEIYISESAHDFIKKEKAISVSPTPEGSQPRPFFKLLGDDQQKSETHLFLYQKAMVHGENAPCFYCGDRRHPPRECPSKQLTELTPVLNHLGYMSLDDFNNLFFNYLNSSTSVMDSGPENGHHSPNSAQTAQRAFLELKAVFQLRFLRTVWNQKEEDWNRAKELKDDSEKGGLLWIGQDCIRVSNFGRAESILSDYLEKNPGDFKAHCSMAFLSIERDQLPMAKQCLKAALEGTRTIPQKIFILFLISRLHELDGDPLRANERTKKILRLSPYCPEAMYRDILFKFNRGKEKVALNQLIKLVKKSREFFVYALIDPELGKFSESVHGELKKVFYEAKNEATKCLPEAEGALEELKRFLGPDEKETEEAQSLWTKTKELSTTESYFAYQDIIHFCSTIINMGHQCLDVRRRKLSRVFSELKSRHKTYTAFTDRFPYPFLIDSFRHQLKTLLPRINKGWDMADSNTPDTFKEALVRSKKLSSSLDQIESNLKRLNRIRNILKFSSKFFKKNLIFQSASLIIGIFLFPIIIHYLNFLMPGIKINPHNIWTYQKGILILGGFSGVFLAILSCSRSIPRK